MWKNREEERWLFWLKKKVEAIGFEVSMESSDPLPHDLSLWLPELQKIHAVDHMHTYFVPQDPGCLTLLTFLQALDKKNQVEPALLVAGFPHAHKHILTAEVNERKLLHFATAHTTVPSLLAKDLVLQKADLKLVILYSGIIEEGMNMPKLTSR